MAAKKKPTPKPAPESKTVEAGKPALNPTRGRGGRKQPASTPARRVKQPSTPATPRPSSQDGAGAEPAKRPATPATNGHVSLADKLAQRQTTGEAPHLIVEARAGTGKTTTLIEGLKRMRGLPSAITPSPQQAAVWGQMALSKGARTVCFVAFNKSIATELQQRVPQGCEAMTMHSMGYKACMKQFGRLEPNSYVVQDLIAEILEVDIRDLRRDDPVVLRATEQLVSLCKHNLVTPVPFDRRRDSEIDSERFDAYVEERDTGASDDQPDDGWNEALEDLAAHYEVDLNGSRQKVFELVPQLLDRCKAPKGKISFDDMIWLPVVLDLPVFKYDLLLVDEAQDLNRCQQALAKKAGKRLILCGDPRQAIYGFAGADALSMPRMGRELGDTSEGCVPLPLTVTRRCGKAIVKEANRIVPDFSAHESNPEGLIGRALYTSYKEFGTTKERPYEKTYMPQVRDGDFILCRVNAPLVSQCFRFLKRGVKANIQGRDIGQGLISTVKKLKASGINDLTAKITDWLAKETSKEQAKRNPNEAKIIALQDRADCLICFTDGQDSVEGVIRKIETVFTDDKDIRGVRLSSVHKSKGLEARRVFILQPGGASMPHPMAKSAWQQEQEMNILYVAITRAIEELVFVS